MEAASHLRLVGESNEFPWPETGELLSIPEAQRRIQEMTYDIDGLTKLTKKQANENAKLSKRVAEDEDPNSHPKGKEIVDLIDHWREVCNHPNSKVSADRVKLVKGRLKDGYEIAELRLAIDGLAAFPFRVYDKRLPTGRQADRHDQLKDALGDSERLEKLANLGAESRRNG